VAVVLPLLGTAPELVAAAADDAVVVVE